MALKALLSKDEFGKLPDALKGEYKQEGDNFVLDVDEKDYKVRLSEFRENNTRLEKMKGEYESALKKFDGVNPDEYKDLAALRDKINLMEESDLIKQGKLDEVISRRTSKLTAGFESEKKQWGETQKQFEDRINSQKGKLHTLLIKDQILSAARKTGNLRKGAESDIARRALEVWKLDDNDNLVPVGPDGKSIPGKTAAVISPEEWAKELFSDAPYLFESGGGGGASGGSGSAQVQGTMLRLKSNEPIPAQYAGDIATGKITVTRD